MIWKLILLSVILTSVLGAPPLRSNVKKDYLMCEVCHVITRDMQLLLEKNATQARVEGYLSEICNRLTANQDSCLTFVKKNIQSVFAKLSDGLDPQQVCILLKVCPSSETEEVKVLPPPISNIILQGTSKEEPESNPIECDICKFIVDYLDKKIVNNRSEAAVNATLTELCNKLPGQLGDVCKKLEPQLLKILEDEFLPAKVCKEVKACSAEAALPSRNLALGCQTCKDVLEGFLGEAGVQMCSEMAGVCGKIKSHRNNHNNMKHFVEPEQIQMPTGQAECTLCKFVVNEVDNLIQNNQTKDNINASLQKICNSLPGELQGLCETFAPELLTAIENGLDPNMACTKIKLCQGEMELDYDVVEEREEKKFDQYDLIEKVMKDADREEKESLKSGPGCAVCKLIVSEVDSLIGQNKSAAEINSTVFNFCNKLPAPLNTLCITYAPMIVKDVLAGFDPEKTCEKIRLCTNGSLSLEEFFPTNFKEQVKKDVKDDSIGCTLCKFIVQEIDTYIGQNQSAAQINASVYNLCSKLPAPLNSLCKTYAPMIVKDVLAGFDPEMTCEKVKLCTNSNLSLEELFPADLKEEVKDIKDSPGCTICKFIVQEIDNYIGQNQSAAQINASVYSLCNKLPGPIGDLCKTYAPMIIKDVLAGFDPEMTCEKVRLCTNDSLLYSDELKPRYFEALEEKDKDNSIGCTLCKFIVQEIDTYIGQNQSAAQINASVYNLCSKLPAPLNSLCITYAPMIVKDVLAGFDPEMTCEKVKLCTNDSLLYSDEFRPRHFDELKENSKESVGCTLCKFIVQEIDTYIGQNQSAAQINASVYNLCNKLPAPLSSLCKTYAPMIVKDVLAGFDPEMTCEKVKLCTKDSLLYSDELKPSYFEELEEKDKDNSIGCTLCKFIVQEIDTYIRQNQSAVQINTSVYNLCNKLPAPLSSLCKTYAPMIVKDVLAGFDPEMTCEKVKLCTNDSFVEPFMKEVKKVEKVVKDKVNVDPVCGLCEFVVQLMDQYLAENKTIGAINASIMGICNLLPTNLKAPCILFAPQVVNIVAGGVAPEDACKAVHLCTDSGKFFHKELTGLSCGKCHGIVEIFLPKKYSPEFGDVMCKSACPVARRRRYASNVKQDWVKFEKEEKLGQTWRCDLCEFIIKAVNTYLETNSTEQSLEDYMNDICNLMPEPFKDTCLKSVPDIIRELSHGVDQDILCQTYMTDECKNDTKPLENEVMNVIEGAAKDNQCDMCKDIIKYIDEGLNHDKGEVKMYVDDVCERLPSPTSKECKTFAAKELEEILIKIIDKLLTPEEVCHMIRVC